MAGRPTRWAMTSIYDFSAKSIDGTDRKLDDYKGDVLLIVNVASACGYTPQYKGLQELQREYAGEGFNVLGFPCNQFGGQEPGAESDIKTFCETAFGVTFPMFGKVDVNGANAHPLFKYLTALPTKPEGPGDIPWNFNKFLVGRDGAVLARFKHKTSPTDETVVNALETALKAPR